MAEDGFTSRQVIAITGVTQRQLGYWRKTGLLLPSHETAGGHARYSFTDLVALKTAKRLIDAGVSVQHMRQVIGSLLGFLPTIEHPMAEVSLVVTGDVVLAFQGEAAFEALTGQEWVFPVADLEREAERVRRQEAEPVQGELFPGELFPAGMDDELAETGS
ncbi:MAG: MerR family transcriptional regulator [Leptospirillia bacterium]